MDEENYNSKNSHQNQSETIEPRVYRPHRSPNLLQPRHRLVVTPPPPAHKRWWLYLVIIILVLLGTNCVVRHYSLSQMPNDGSAYDPITLKPIKTGFLTTVKNYLFNSSNVLSGENENRINILLMGMGGEGHEGAYLTDTNIILSIKPDTRQVAMISVPRDLGVNIPGYGVNKINHANAYGESKQPDNGGEFARALFAKTFQMDIPYYIRVDFKAFEDMVNAVGGITIDVPRAFTDSAFPGANESYITIRFESGKQTMDGVTALQYARSRHGNNGEGSDFARSRRQQLVLSALKEKLLSFGTYTNPVKIQQILNTLSTHVTTNLNFDQIMYLASLARETKSDIKNLVLDDAPAGFLTSYTGQDGAYLLAPKDSTFEAVNAAIKNIFTSTSTPSYTGTFVKPESSTTKEVKKEIVTTTIANNIEIQNGTWRAGLASKFQVKLEAQGLTVNGVGNCVRRPIDKTTIYVINKEAATDTIAALEKEFDTQATTSLPDWLTTTTDSTTTLNYKANTDILVILGEDATK